MSWSWKLRDWGSLGLAALAVGQTHLGSGWKWICPVPRDCRVQAGPGVLLASAEGQSPGPGPACWSPCSGLSSSHGVAMRRDSRCSPAFKASPRRPDGTSALVRGAPGTLDGNVRTAARPWSHSLPIWCLWWARAADTEWEAVGPGRPCASWGTGQSQGPVAIPEHSGQLLVNKWIVRSSQFCSRVP